MMITHSKKVNTFNFFDKKELNEKSIDSTRSEVGLFEFREFTKYQLFYLGLKGSLD